VRAGACPEASAAAAVRVLLPVDNTAVAPLILGPLAPATDAGTAETIGHAPSWLAIIVHDARLTGGNSNACPGGAA